MKKIIKYFALLTALAALIAVMSVAAFAAETDPFDMSLVFSPETQLVVYVDGEWSGALSDTYGYGESVSLTAPAVENKVFAYWQAEGSVISYANPLKLTVNANTTLYAVYAAAKPAEQPAAGFTSITRSADGKSIVLQAIASGETAGIVYSTTATGNALTIGSAGVTSAAAEKLTNSTTTIPDSVLDNNNCWMLQITPDNANTVYHARAYVTVDGTTTYGDVKDVKLSELQSGIFLVANLEGFEPGINDTLAGLTTGMHTVTYNANGGAGATITQAFVGSSVTLRSNTFTREGYTFSGWATEKNGSVVYKDGDEAILAEDVTLYAQWKSNASPAPASTPTTGPLTVTSEIGTITRVTVDGKTVNSKYYFVSGSNVVLSEEFMSTLAPGKHTIRLYDGKTSATATWTIEGTASAQQAKTAATGDAGVTHYGVLAAAAAVAICAILACAWVAKKRKAA